MATSSHFRITKKTLPISGCTFTLSDIKRVYEALEDKVREAAELQVANWVKPEGDAPETFEANKKLVKDLFTLTVLIRGTDGSELQGSNADVFDSRNMPEDVASIYFDSTTDAKTKNFQYIGNSLSLFLDFTKPRLLNLRLPPNDASSNASNAAVNGISDTWVESVSSKITDFVNRRRNGHRFLHGAGTYDLLPLVCGLPFGFWLCGKSFPYAERWFAEMPVIVQSAFYVYVVLSAVWVFRLLLAYAKWTWPLVELESDRSAAFRHRALWFAVAVGVLGGFVWDVIKALLKLTA